MNATEHSEDNLVDKKSEQGSVESKLYEFDKVSKIPEKPRLRRCCKLLDIRKDKTNMFFEDSRSISSNFSVTGTIVLLILLGTVVYFNLHKCIIAFAVTTFYRSTKYLVKKDVYFHIDTLHPVESTIGLYDFAN